MAVSMPTFEATDAIAIFDVTDAVSKGEPIQICWKQSSPQTRMPPLQRANLASC
jgi:hypothetical protein